MIRIYLILIVLIFPFITFGQRDTSIVNDSLGFSFFDGGFTKYGVVFGISQLSYTYLEVGIAKAKGRLACIWGSYFHGLSLSGEWRPNPDPKNIGILLTAWHSGGPPISWGINFNSYSDFTHTSLGIRPMLGLGSQNVQLVYGYNIIFINNDLVRLNKHTISLRIFFPLIVS